MQDGLLKTELICHALWGSHFILVMIPKMTPGEKVYLDLNSSKFGKIKGFVEVLEVSHYLDGHGYVQRVSVQPLT